MRQTTVLYTYISYSLHYFRHTARLDQDQTALATLQPVYPGMQPVAQHLPPFRPPPSALERAWLSYRPGIANANPRKAWAAGFIARIVSPACVLARASAKQQNKLRKPRPCQDLAGKQPPASSATCQHQMACLRRRGSVVSMFADGRDVVDGTIDDMLNWMTPDASPPTPVAPYRGHSDVSSTTIVRNGEKRNVGSPGGGFLKRVRLSRGELD